MHTSSRAIVPRVAKLPVTVHPEIPEDGVGIVKRVEQKKDRPPESLSRDRPFSCVSVVKRPDFTAFPGRERCSPAARGRVLRLHLSAGVNVPGRGRPGYTIRKLRRTRRSTPAPHLRHRFLGNPHSFPLLAKLYLAMPLSSMLCFTLLLGEWGQGLHLVLCDSEPLGDVPKRMPNTRYKT